MELTKEYFDEVVSRLATKQALNDSKEEILFRITEAVATVQEEVDPEHRLSRLEQKFDRFEKHLHVEL